jgi:anti-sigma B factor antagonist
VSGNIRIDTVSNTPHAVVLIRGEIDAASGPELTATVESLPDTVTTVELDLSEVSFVDSTGLGMIASLVNRLEPSGGQVLLRNPSDLVVRLLTVTDLLQFVTIVQDPT